MRWLERSGTITRTSTPRRGCELECSGQGLVGNEVGGDDPDSPLRCRTPRKRGPRRAGRRRRQAPLADNLGDRAAGSTGGGAILLRGEGFARGEFPVGAEQFGEIEDGRARADEREVTPTLWVGGRPHVLLGQIHATAQCVPTIDHDDLAMVPQVGASAERQVEHGHEEGDLGPGRGQGSKKAAADALGNRRRRAGAAPGPRRLRAPPAAGGLPGRPGRDRGCRW